MRNLSQHISDLQSGYKDRRKQRVFGTGYDPKCGSIEQDYYTDESGSSSGGFVLRPACLRGGGQATCPQIPGTDLKVLGFNIGAQVARDSIVPAGRVFSLQATWLVSSTGRDGGGVGC